MSSLDLKTILAALGIASFGFTAGMVPKCSEVQTVAMAKEQFSRFDKDNQREHDKLFNEIKNQREQQQKTLNKIIEILQRKNK